MKEKKNRMQKIIQKIPGNKRLCYGLGVCLLILAGTGVYQTFAAAKATPSASIVTFSNQSTSYRKSSQLLEVKTDGFAKNAYLQYTYENNLYQMTDKNIILASIRVNSTVCIFPNAETYEYSTLGTSVEREHVLPYGKTKTTNQRYLAVKYGEKSYDTLSVTVKDINPDSTTYNETASTTMYGTARCNQSQDLGQGMGAMFVGEKKEIRELISTAGVTTGMEAKTISDIKDFSITKSYDGLVHETGDLRIEGYDGFVDAHRFSASGPGVVSTRFTINRDPRWLSESFYINSTIWIRPLNNATGSFDFYLFEKKPYVTAKPTYITVDNTIKGVTYTIGTDSQTAQSDNETLTFGKEEKLMRGQDYQLVVSKAVNGKTARAFVKVTTPEKSSIRFDYNGVTPTSSLGGSASVDYGIENLSKFNAEALGYDFLSWNSAPDGTGTNYSQTVVEESDLTVYAQWKQRKYDARITVREDKALLGNAKVELYQYGKKLYELTEAGETGVYEGSKISYAAYEEKNGAYDIYVDGIDSGVNLNMTGKEKDGATVESAVYCYTAAVDLKQNGQVWADQNVRIEKAGSAYVLPYDAGTQNYHARFTYGEEKPKDGPYYIYVNEKMVKGEKGTVTFHITADVDQNKVSVSYYDMEVTLRKDGQPWGDAQVSLYRDGILQYGLSYDPAAQTYRSDSILDVGAVYQLYVKGSNSKEDVGIELSQSKAEAAVDYYTVSFEDDVKTYSKQVWKSGDRAKKPNTPVREGSTFRQWNKAPDGSGEAYFTSGQTTTEPVTGPVSIYAVWEQPDLVIGNYVRVDENGAQDGKGLYYRMPNLSMIGFPKETGKTPIRVIKIQTTNENTKVTVKNAGTYKVTGEGTSAVTISLPGGASVTEAEQFIRTNILIKPDGDSQSHSCRVQVFGRTS